MQNSIMCQSARAACMTDNGPGCRRHVSVDNLADAEQNDAVEALEVLLGVVVSRVEAKFGHRRDARHASQDAWRMFVTGALEPQTGTLRLAAARSAGTHIEPDQGAGPRELTMATSELLRTQPGIWLWPA
jgi:hypothetical protein